MNLFNDVQFFWYYQVIAAFMKGNTVEFVAGQGITEGNERAALTRDSPSSKLEQAWKLSSWKLLSYFWRLLRLLSSNNTSPSSILFPCYSSTCLERTF